MNGEIPMKKKALLAALLAMTLLLSSCALVVKDKEVDAATVILKMGDTEITKAQVEEAVNTELYEMAEYYSYFGSSLDTSDPEVIASAQSSAIAALKQDMVLRAKAAELGLDQLTDEETAQAKEDADSGWESAKSIVKSSYLSEEEKALEGEALDQAILNKLEELGVHYEDYEEQAKDTVLSAKMKDYIVKDVEVSEEEIRTEYDSKVAADEEKYKEDASSWTTADRNSTTLYYTPAGIRRVKQILIKFKEEDQTAIDDANAKITSANSRITDAEAILNNEEAAEEDKTLAQADLDTAKADLEAAQAELKAATDAAFANLDEDADAVLAALAENPDSWDQLMEEKNEDPGMKPGTAGAEKGYAVCANMAGFDSAFVDAAMALQSVGDVSGKVRGETYGYYIIKYFSDETEGPVDYDSVKDAIQSSLLSTKQNETYTQTVDQWVADAGIKEDLGALNN